MAQGESGEKTEEPTPQKLRKAREKGQVAKSRDAVSALVFVGAVATLFLSFGWFNQTLLNFIRDAMQSTSSRHLDAATDSMMAEALWLWLLLSLPAISAAFFLGLAGNYIQIGFLLTGEPLKPDLKKISPLSGFKQMFSKDRLVELLKQVAKFTVVSWVVYVVVRDSIGDLILTQRMDFTASVTVLAEIIYKIMFRVAILFIIIAVADYFWQRYSFKKKMMMTKYEVKQEYKQSEGDPEVKAERRRLAEELIMHGGQEAVAGSDAVVTNPVHVAVAIKYEEDKHSAPKIVAKGMRLNAEKIKEIARNYNVPIVRNVPLAQALHKLDIDEEIPEELYEAVAEVLNFVYQLKKSTG